MSTTSVPIDDLPLPPRVRYGGEVVSSLRARAKAQASSPDLREELAILRELLNDSVDAYDHAVEEAIKGKLDVHRVKIAAGGLVAMAIERIERVAYTQSRISSSKFLAMPDVNALIDTFVGTVDTELAQHAGMLRMAGLDPEKLMLQLSDKLRDLQAAQAGAAMAEYGPHGYTSLAEARAAANEEAAAMDDTVPECVIIATPDIDEEVA